MQFYIKYKNQTQGLHDVAETVKTAEKVAASSIHFLKHDVDELGIYTKEIKDVITRLSLFYQKKDHPLLRTNSLGKNALIICSSDKGLVGDLWYKLVNFYLERNKTYSAIIVIGAKIDSYLKEEGVDIIKSFSNDHYSQEEYVYNITEYIFSAFKNSTFNKVDILYPKFVSLAEQVPKIISFLPFKFDFSEESVNNIGFPIFEPNKKVFFDNLLKKYIMVFFYKIFMEAKLSELAARTITMEEAVVKTNHLIKKIEFNYHKERRHVINQRQLESFSAHKV